MMHETMETLEWQTARELAYLDSSDWVRRNSNGAVTARIDAEVLERVRDHAGRPRDEISRRIAALEGEWDIERALEGVAASITLLGLALGARNRRMLLLPAIVAAMLLQHSTRGWSAPASLLRRLGLRTRREIDVEKFALKHLRGDFEEESAEESLLSSS